LLSTVLLYFNVDRCDIFVVVVVLFFKIDCIEVLLGINYYLQCYKKHCRDFHVTWWFNGI